MGAISIKVVANKIHIQMHSSFDKSKNELNEKLQIFKAEADRKIEVFFQSRDILGEQELKELFIMMNQNNHIIASFTPFEKKNHMMIIEKQPRSGQRYQYDTDVLFCTDIPFDVSIELTSGDAYVMGEVCGSVECLGLNQQIMAQSFSDGKIKIYDSSWHTVNAISRTCCSYENQRIKVTKK